MEGDSKSKILDSLDKARSNVQSSLKVSALSQQDRSNIQKLFNLFGDLSEKKIELSSELKKATQALENGLMEASTQLNFKDVKYALRFINWDKGAIRITKGPIRRKDQTLTYDVLGWGDWDKNPFKHFFSRKEEFMKKLSEATVAAQAIAQAKGEIIREMGMWAWGASHSQKTLSDLAAKGKANSAIKFVELKVAKKLLEKMNQLKKN